MCTTTQYLYVCSHPATHRFRNTVCAAPNSRACHVQDENSTLPYTCTRCAAKGRTKPFFNIFGPSPDAENDLFKDVWYIPSRCFVDIGFKTLDPFGTGESIEAPSPNKSMPEQEHGRRLCLPFGEQAYSYGNQKMRVKRVKRIPSPCCLQERRQGAYEATRLEGCEDRIEGRIMDSGCSSQE